MVDSVSVWPLKEKPANGTRVILASQGHRIWTAEATLKSFDESMELECGDGTTLENLERQGRVAFTVLDPRCAVQGSCIADVNPDGLNEPLAIRLEPYRIMAEGKTWELKLAGWTPVEETPLPDTSTYSFWYQAFRMVTLPLSLMSVLVGGLAAFAHGSLNVWLLLLALIGVGCAHAGANAVADYFDFKNGVDLSKALSSHLGALARERIEPDRMLLAAFTCFLVTAATGAALLLATGWPLLYFGLAGLAGAYFYTGWPVSYKYHSLGELTLGVVMGPVTVMGAYYVQTRGWEWGVFLLSVALGMLISSASLANNLRDLPDDRTAGIHTLPMRLGVSSTRKLYYLLIGGPYLVVGAAVLVQPLFWPVALCLISLPLAFRAIGALRGPGDDIDDIRRESLTNPYPLNSIKLHFRFATLMVIGLIAAEIIPLLAG